MDPAISTTTDPAERNRIHEQFISQFRPNPDGPDYDCGGKYEEHRGLLRGIRDPGNSTPDDVKPQAIEYLKEDVFPFFERCEDVHKQERDELLAVYLKYNGPDGIRTRLQPELNEKRGRVMAFGLDDDNATEAMTKFIPYDSATGVYFWFGKGGYVTYHNMHKELSTGGSDSSDFEPPVINHIPLGTAENGNMAHHHNINPDDDLSLNPGLLELLRGLMKLKNAQPFINFAHEKNADNYQGVTWRPRCLSFIEQGLQLDPSIGYGSTAFFNDMLLVFTNTRKGNPFLYTEENRQADGVESVMMKRLKTMGSAGAKLLVSHPSRCNIQLKQGPEDWSDPEMLYFKAPHNPHLDNFDGTKPDENKVRTLAWWQVCLSRKRVQKLRASLASTAPTAHQDTQTPGLDSGAPLDQRSGKRSHEQSVEPEKDGPSRVSKRPMSNPGINPNHCTDPLGQPGLKSYRQMMGLERNDEEDEIDQSEVVEERAPKRQRLTEPAAVTNLAATSSGPSRPGPSAARTRLAATSSGPSRRVPTAAPVQRRSSKRLRAQADADNDSDDDDDGGESHGASRSKRRRLTKDTNSAGLPHASPEAGPSTASKEMHEPAALLSHSGQARASSAAGQPAPEQGKKPVHYPAPASQALPSSRNTVAMSKLAKMGKTRPWVFGYSTDEGYGLYAFMKCPRRNCKQRFASDSLRNNHARDHLSGCGQAFIDEQDMVRQYASQVVKDAGRKSDLTVDWARNSNMNLLPSNEKDNHPDNFPQPPADE
ncbi:hypothetical protein KVR01_002305 [Diaporthe batatas]|uniref:uncharacterized protein n=1 Tax=Diaporthe batatas TaxID=748121 RepID=UPI001D048845|nr:uncharacterized protein KVR01_002305 [Diaporthe batatas]KAG8166616.1 hypothetical protein KVR01_002305 [Diaporthe batatas]